MAMPTVQSPVNTSPLSATYSLRRVGESRQAARPVGMSQDGQASEARPERSRRPAAVAADPGLGPEEFAREAFSVRDARAVREPASSSAEAEAQLSAEEQAQLRELQARDAEVRAHEAAHLGAAGGLAISGARYSYTTGPDGRQYATGGEVSIDASEGATPEETLVKSRKIQAAALAPANPSPTDLQVAAKAASMAMRAAAELTEASLKERVAGRYGEAMAALPGAVFEGMA